MTLAPGRRLSREVVDAGEQYHRVKGLLSEDEQHFLSENRGNDMVAKVRYAGTLNS